MIGLLPIIIIILFALKLIFGIIFRRKSQTNFNVTNLPGYMSLVFCPEPLSDQHDCRMAGERPLVVIFAWLLAQDKHLFKFRQLWLQRGFDVLIVRSTPLNMALPPIGSQRVAKNVVKILSEMKYKEIVIHSFSAGGYQFGEVLVHLSDSLSEDHSLIVESIRAVVLDSVVAAADAPVGLALTLTDNTFLQSIILQTHQMFLKLFHSITVKHYNRSEHTFHYPPTKCPVLVFYSKDDKFSNYENVEKMITNRRKQGIDIQVKCWDRSTHVSHYRHYKNEYEQQLDKLLIRLNLQK